MPDMAPLTARARGLAGETRMRLARPPHWHRASRLHRRRLPAKQRGWILAEGSLTGHLRVLCPQRFTLAVLREARWRPRSDEARALRLRGDRASLIREVALRCGDEPLVIARTVIPATTLRGKVQRLARLGSQPLGALLFTDKTARRGPLELGHLTLAQAGISQAPPVDEPVWARRAVFHLGGAPLLVSEFFLPALFTRAAASTPPRPGQAESHRRVTSA